jgi:hypothetical protein
MITIETLRAPHIFGYAIFDLVATFIGIYLLAPVLTRIFLKLGLNIPRSSWLMFALPLGIIIHLLVGNITPMTRDFLDLNGHFMLKILIIALTILGVRGIK